MKTLYDTKLIEFMPEAYREIDEVKWICAAAQAQIDKIIAQFNKILFMHFDGLDDITLDYLLTECGIANSIELTYLSSRQDKITFIKNYVTLKRYKGTKRGLIYVLELLDINASILEWFEYEGKPFTFKISIPNQENLSPSDLNLLDALIYAYKNTRSHFSYDDNKYFKSNYFNGCVARVVQTVTFITKEEQ